MDVLRVNSRLGERLALGVLVSAVALAASGCAQSDGPVTARESSVRTFTYDPAKHIGTVLGSETFDNPVTNRQAATSIEAFLGASDSEFRTFFPKVPEDVQNGKFTCTVEPAKNSRHFTFNCNVTPVDKHTTVSA